MNLSGLKEYLSNFAEKNRVPLQALKASTRARPAKELSEMKCVRAIAAEIPQLLILAPNAFAQGKIGGSYPAHDRRGKEPA
jgi:hypothetical protein